MQNFKSSGRAAKSLEKKIKASLPKICFMCSEYRALDLCHVFPAYILQCIGELQYLAGDPRNYIVLCKTHHYLFDNRLLTEQEAQLLKLGLDKYIKEILLNVVNSQIVCKDADKLPLPIEVRVNRFYKWLNWFSNYIFTPLND